MRQRYAALVRIGVSALRRLSWGLGDQVLSSLTNFALTVAVARAVTPAAFGLFAAAMTGFIFVLAVVRGLTSDPLQTVYSGSGRDQLRQRAPQALATGLSVGLAIGGPLVVAGLLIGGGLGWTLVALGAVLPGVLLQDGIRFVGFAGGHPRTAFLNDLAWAVLQIGGVVVATEHGVDQPAWLLLLWGAGGTVCGLVGLAQVRLVPTFSAVATWCRDHRQMWRYYVPENALMNGTNFIVVMAVAAIAGLAATGSLRAAVSVFGPLAVISLGARAVLVPEFVRQAERSVDRMYRLSVVVSLGLAGLGLAWGTACFLAPRSVGEALFGQSWDLARPLLPLVMIDSVTNLFVIGCFIGLRATGVAHRGFRVRAIMVLPRIAMAVVGASLDGARGAAIGFVLLAPVQLVLWSVQLRRAVAERHAVPRPDVAPSTADPSY